MKCFFIQYVKWKIIGHQNLSEFRWTIVVIAKKVGARPKKMTTATTAVHNFGNQKEKHAVTKPELKSSIDHN